MAAEDIVRKFADAINQHDLNAFTAMWDESAVIHDPTIPQPIRGREAIRQNVDAWFTAFPDLQFKPSNIILSSGDTIAFEVDLGGTNSGPLQTPQGSAPATNKPMEFRGCGFWRVNAQGLIVEERRYYDSATIMGQLGITPQ